MHRKDADILVALSLNSAAYTSSWSLRGTEHPTGNRILQPWIEPPAAKTLSNPLNRCIPLHERLHETHLLSHVQPPTYRDSPPLKMSTNTERGERPPGDKPELLVVNKAIKRRWQKYLWDSLDKPSQERKFLFKLDAALMTFAFLGKNLAPCRSRPHWHYPKKNRVKRNRILHQTPRHDQHQQRVRIRHASLPFICSRRKPPGIIILTVPSSRKENLSLYGNELNYMQTCSTVGFVIGKIPSNIVLTRIGPSIWIPSIEVNPPPKNNPPLNTGAQSSQVTWAVLTFCLCRCTNARQIYVLRFFAGNVIISLVSDSNLLAELTIVMRRSCRKHLSPRHTVCDRLLVPE